jgi:hypothetical protein
VVTFAGSAAEMDGMTEENPKANKAGAGNGAGALLFNGHRLRRAVPDLCRSAADARDVLTA